MDTENLTLARTTIAGILALTVLWGCDGDDAASVEETAATSPAAGGRENAREVTQYSIDDFMGSVTYRGLSFSPDGEKLLTSSNASGIYNVVAIPAEGGDPEAITHSETNSIFVIGYFPDDERMLYRADQSGNEMQHIYVREIDGAVIDLTPGDGRFMAQFHGWAEDGKSFYVRTNERNIRHFDLYEIETVGYARKLVYQNDDLYVLGPVSPDRRLLVLEKGTDNRSKYLAIYDFETGNVDKITPSDVHISNTARSFSPNGRYLYYTTDKWNEFQYLVRYDVEAGKHEKVVTYDWDVAGPFGSDAIKFSRDGSRLLVATNQNARTVIDVFDTATLQRIGGSETPAASVASFDLSDDGTKLALIVTNGQVPGDIFVQEVGQGTPTRIMTSLSNDVNADDLVAGEVVRFHSFDGVIVPGILYRPHQADAGNKVPAMVYVHGGPGGQTRIGYNVLIQYLVNHGYAVFGVNNRGSSGNGKTFFHLDDQDHGGGDLKDVVASKRMLVQTGWVDPERIGIMGGSYGGFITLAALAFYPDVFDVGVDRFGIANWVDTLKNPPPWWAARWVAMLTEMGDFYDEAHWRSRSPYFHADKIKRPMIVLQGANDPRVKKVESDKMVAVARENGVAVEYVVFDDEGHGFRKKKNQTRESREILKFLDNYLKGSAGT